MIGPHSSLLDVTVRTDTERREVLMTVYKVSETVKMFVGGREREIDVIRVFYSRHPAEMRLMWLNDHRVPARLIIEKEEE